MPPFIKKSQGQQGRASYVIGCCFNLNELTDILAHLTKNQEKKRTQKDKDKPSHKKWQSVFIS